jgi:trans-aconitate 2-methyltransferase
VVVLPDVIEHIPVEHHSALFARVAGWLGDSGFALLNYPNPHWTEWCMANRPDLLQVIDQAIGADQLVANAYPHGLYLDRYETYSIWVREGDYVSAVLRPRAAATTFTQIPEEPPSLVTRAAGKLRRLVRS